MNRQTLLTGTQALVVAAILLSVLSPFSTPLLVGGTFVVQAFWVQRDHGDLWNTLRTAVLTRGWIALAAFVGYLVLRLFPNVMLEALPGVAAMVAYALLTFGAFSLFQRQNDDVQYAITQALLAGFALAALVHLFELLSGFALRRLFWTWMPMFRPRFGKIDVDGGNVRVLVPFIANQSSAVLVALVWPVLLLDTLTARPRWQRVAIWLSVLVAAAAILMSDQATSKMALAVGVATWAVVAVLPRSTRPLLGIGWLASTLLVLPAALYAYKAETYKLPPNFSAQHRVVLWGVTAEKTLQHPLTGIGTGHTPDFDDSTRADVRHVPGTQLPIATNRHAHNVFLQTWYEDGLVGVLLFSLAGLAVIGWIAKAPHRAQPLLAAAFAASIMSASFSYSLLASWFIATFTVAAMLCRFAVTQFSEASSRRHIV